MANPFQTQARQLLESMGLAKPNDNVRIQEFTAVDTIYFAANTAVTAQKLFTSSRTVVAPYRNIAFPDTSRSYVFTNVAVDHDFQFTAATAGAQNWQLNNFNRYSTFQWTINGVASPLFQQDQFMSTQFQTIYNDSLGTPVQQLYPIQKVQTWYPLADPVNIAAGMNIDVAWTPLSGLTTIASFATASTPYAPGLATSAAQCTLRFQWNGFQYSIIT